MCGDDARHIFWWGNVKRRVPRVNLIDGGWRAERLSDFSRVPFFYFNIGAGGFFIVPTPRKGEIGNIMGVCRDGILIRADFIYHMTIHRDQVRRRDIFLDFAFLHNMRRHVIGDQFHFDP